MSASTTSPVGETSLPKLLSTLTTVVHSPTYVFVTLKGSTPIPPLVDVQMMFRETEGATLIMKRESAEDRGLEFEFPSRMITLNVHSSLEAVGFMAVIATRLASKGMGMNPVSGFYHDHLFVPEGREDEAIAELKSLVDEEKKKQQQQQLEG